MPCQNLEGTGGRLKRIRQGEVEANGEEQEDDADLGDGVDLVLGVDDAEATGTRAGPCGEQGHQRGHAESSQDQEEDERDRVGDDEITKEWLEHPPHQTTFGADVQPRRGILCPPPMPRLHAMSQIDRELVNRLARHLGLEGEEHAAAFLQTAAGTWSACPRPVRWRADFSPLVIIENANGVLVSDATRCIGCCRCELACTEYHDGRSQPSIARIKVARNYNFGPRQQQAGTGRAMGQFGNLRIVQDTCKQCPHPVPCATACPNEAIVLDAKTRARIVDRERCQGCRLCLRACPWEMMSFDAMAGKATKCFLCDGRPACVDACPAMALQYVPWRDLTRAVPIRQAALAVTRDYSAAGCTSCHRPKR
jgi:Fe-S-cluster-containing dehydrogenase component